VTVRQGRGWSRDLRVIGFWATIAAGVLGTALPAHGNGYDYPDLGARALGRGAAFVAKADDPTALYYNPAGAARLSGTRLLLSATLIMTRTTFQRHNYANPDGNLLAYPHDPTLTMPQSVTREGPFPAPLFMATTDLGGLLRPANVVLLVGLYGPNSHRNVTLPRFCKAGVSACEEGGPDGLPNPARYDAISRAVLVLFPSLGAAWRPLPWLSVGAVFQLGYANFEYETMVGAAIGENPDGDVGVELDISSKLVPTGILGVHLRPLPWLEIGASARIAFTFEGSGEVRTNVSPRAEAYLGVPIRTEPNPAPAWLDFNLPWVVRTGVRYVYRDAAGRERFDVEFDYVFENTSVLQRFDVRTTVDVLNDNTGQPFIPTLKGIVVQHGWVDSHSFRLGGSFSFYELWDKVSALTLRAGLLYETSPMPQEFTRLDFLALERYGLTLGASLTFGRYRFDVGYAALLHEPRTVRPDAGRSPCGDFGSQQGCGSRVRSIVPLKANRAGAPVGNGRYTQVIHLLALGFQVNLDLPVSSRGLASRRPTKN
jgi:long-chain fatty acid transport protein